MPIDLESELDRLYGVEVGEFVAERTRLVRALRKEGCREEASRAQELRKPSLPAWTVNQLVRRNRKDVDLLLDAGDRLTQAHAALLGGGEQRAFAEAREREQAVVKRLREAAREILGQRASEATLERITSTLRAAVVTAEGREQLVQGRLTSEIEPPGFEAFADSRLAGSAIGKAASPPRGKAPQKRAGDGSRKQAQQEAKAQEAKARARANLKAAREREATLAKQLRKADQAVHQARKALEAAQQEAKRLEADRDEATKVVEVFRRELDAATET